MPLDFHPTGDRIELPADFSKHLAELYGQAPPATMWEWWLLEGEQSTRADDLAAEDFYTDEPTRHAVHLGDTVRHAPCVLDALAAAAMETGRSAVVRSADPMTDGVVTVAFDDSSVRVTPETAVVSIGGRQSPEVVNTSHVSVIDHVTEGDGAAYVEDFCAYRLAFESSTTYDDWAADVDGVTFPASAATLARLLHRLHRASSFALYRGILRTALRERLSAWRDG